MNKLLKYGAAAGVLASLAPYAAKAQDDASVVVNSTDAAAVATATTASAGLAVGLLIFWGIFAVIALALFIFWIVMLIDVFKRTNWQDEGQKNLWMIIMIVSLFVSLYGLAAIIYYFVVKRALDKGGKAPAAPQAPQTPAQK